MSLWRRIRLAVVSAIVPAAIGGLARAEDLGQAWSIALGVNRQLQSQQYQTRSNDLSLAAARSARLPTVRNFTADALLTPNINVLGTAAGASTSAKAGNGTFSGLNQPNFVLSNTSVNYSIYTGGRLKANVEAAGAQLQAQRSEECRTALELKLTVAEAYVAVLRAIRNLEVARSDVARLASFAQDVRNRMQAGVVTRNDELAAEVSLSNARQAEIRSRRALAVAWATYNRYLCRPLSDVADLEDLKAAESPRQDMAPADGPLGDHPAPGAEEAEIAALVGVALKTRPELAGLAQQALALEAQSRSTRAGIRPQVSVMTGYTYIGADILENKSFFTSLFLVDWTLSDFGTTRRRALAQRNQEFSTLKRRDDQADTIALEVRSRWLEVEETRLRLPVARLAVDQARENITVVTDRYRQGLSTYTEVLDAENRRVQSYNNLYDANYEAVLAVLRLRRAVGNL